MTRRLRLLAALAVVVSGVSLIGPGSAPGALASGSKPAFSATRTVTRDTWFGSAGAYKPFHQEKSVTVTADKVTDLRGRERVTVAWSGATPSAARAANPYGEKGLLQEYPVVVMQCRGVDDPSAPAVKQIRPETCWTSSYFQRSQVAISPSAAIWAKDPKATTAEQQRLSGGLASWGADWSTRPAGTCNAADLGGYWTHLTQFRARSGKVFPACDRTAMPPEAAVDSAFPPSEVAAFTDADGKGSVKFEVRSDIENESLGCKDGVACSIVVIPIMGTSCAVPTGTADDADRACKETGNFTPGTDNYAEAGVDNAVSPAMWWTPSNWANRISVPIDFGLPPDACDLYDDRLPTSFYGSELLAQASLQWAPAYCLSQKRFKFQHGQMGDVAGFELMEGGSTPAAFVSSAHKRTTQVPVAYAPTAVTGFGIGYVIDRPGNAGEFHQLRLNARLLAKLLTMSYPASGLGTKHPGLEANPISINRDPEFQQLNPGLTDNDIEAAATLFSLNESSDVVEQLTAYIDADPDARAFLDGEKDPWGARVNPSYQDIELPVAQWPLLDTFVPKSDSTCLQANKSVYLQQVANPVNKMRLIAQALVDAWPLSTTRCYSELNGAGEPIYKIGRAERQSYGARFMLGLIDLGDAARFGIDVAALQTKHGTYVAADDAGMASATALLKAGDPLAPFTLDQAAVRKSSTAYPGTTVVYTVAHTQGLDKDLAAKVAMFIRIATSEGQTPGRGNGELPEGYLPLKKTGVTARLLTAALKAADVIEKQFAPAATTPAETPVTPTTADAGVTAVVPAAAPPAGAAGAPTTDVELASAGLTADTSSRLGGALLPLLLFGALFGLVSSVVIRVHALVSR